MYYIYQHGVLIGMSELEGDDEAIGFRSGRFYPAADYQRIQPVINELSNILYERCITDPISSRENELRQIVSALQLSITTDIGEPIDTSGIDIVDYSDALGEDGIDVTILVKDRRTYDKFFCR